MQSDRWLQLILPKKCARCFFLLSKNISCTETACLLLRIISFFKFLGVLELQNFLASKNSCNEYFVEQTKISLVLKSFWFGNSRPALKNKLFFRVLELQNFFKSKILAMKIFFSKHKSSQMLKAAIQPTVFLWILYPLGIWHLQTG